MAITSLPDLFEQTFNNAPIGIALVSPDGLWIKVNRALCKLTGYSARELYSITFQDITYPEDLEADLRNVKNTLDGTIDGYTMEKRYITKHGEIIWARLSVSLVKDSEGNPDFFISHIENMQPQKDLENSLRQDASQLSSIIDAISDPLLVKNEQYKTILVNRAFCEFTGRTREELIGTQADTFLDKKVAAKIAAADKKVFQAEEPMTFEGTIPDHQNNDRFIAMQKSIYKNLDGKKYLVEVLRDITDQQNHNEQMTLKNDELESINKVMMGRELRMIELKDQLSELKKRLG